MDVGAHESALNVIFGGVVGAGGVLVAWLLVMGAVRLWRRVRRHRRWANGVFLRRLRRGSHRAVGGVVAISDERTA